MAGKKVLVVDDEPDFLEMLRLRLKSDNCNVVTAANGKEALEKIETEKPDVVLLDIMMPGMDGLDVLKRIRKKHKDLPVFMITAFSNQERFKIANNFNASGFIIKTDDLQSEIDNIKSVISLSGEYKR